MNPLLTYYRQIIEAVGLIIADDGTVMVHHNLNKDPEPVRIMVENKEKVLVLPTDELIKDGDWGAMVAFHPASESMHLGQSEVLNELAYYAAARLHDSVQMAIANISSLALNKGVHGKLNLSQKQLLISCDGIDNAVAKLIIDIAKKNTGVKGARPLLSLRLERGGVIDDEVYNRTCQLMTHVLNNPDKFCGVTPSSAKAKKIVRALYEYVFPEQRIYGSNSSDMPYLFALLECFYAVAKHLNGIKNTLGKYGTMREIPLAWHDEMKGLGKLAKRYLPQPMQGNKGLPIATAQAAAKAEDELVEEAELAAAPAPVTAGYKSILDKAGLVKLADKLPKPVAPTAAPAVHNPMAPPQQPAQAQAAPLTTEQMLNAYTSTIQPVNQPHYGHARPSFGTAAAMANRSPAGGGYNYPSQSGGYQQTTAQQPRFGTRNYGR